MLFNSFHFLIFFILVTSTYFVLPHKHRWLLLLISSCYFYMIFVPIYILILGFTIVIDYFAGIYLEKITGKRRKLFLILSLVANIGVLAIFKYYNFINDNLTVLLQGMGVSNPVPYLQILLPIGLSFHTFQAMSYTIEVYRGNQKAEKNFGIYSLYVMFYPQLVAGPIERPQNILHQFYEEHSFDAQRVADGLKMIIWGLFKKVVIADRLAVYVNEVYNHPDNQSPFALILATYFFTFQIYCDFSGYSDIALGTSWVMGFDLMENFRTPYVARSVSEFWARWHISLSTWFRDYLYIPLGGNRVGKSRWYFNLFIVFMVSGIWHGANWTYIIWGALHGSFLVIENIGKDLLKKVKISLSPIFSNYIIPFFQLMLTFHLAVFAWIFFRANTVKDAFVIIRKIAQFNFHINKQVIMQALGTQSFQIFISILLLIGFILIDPIADKQIKQLRKGGKIAYSAIIFAILLAIVSIFGFFGEVSFIYFQF